MHPDVGAHVKVEVDTPVQRVAAHLRWWSPNNEDIHQSKTAIGTIKSSLESFTVKAGLIFMFYPYVHQDQV